MLVSDRCYCIHQPKTAIASLPRVLGKMREALAIPQGIALIVASRGEVRSHSGNPTVEIPTRVWKKLQKLLVSLLGYQWNHGSVTADD